jgi:hypothetical protein
MGVLTLNPYIEVCSRVYKSPFLRKLQEDFRLLRYPRIYLPFQRVQVFVKSQLLIFLNIYI